ncbi:hypothetical protein M1N82_01650 [Dehalococcoidia bacterium]|nr:hypothetical protein [Dehalococcoidia bacterium]MCL0084237.1 hypothetical protein [Dehalococcoidia bacterium]
MSDELRIEGQEGSPPPEGDIGTLLAKLEEAFSPRISHGKATGTLVVALDLRGLAGRTDLEVWLKSSGAADFFLEGSVDGKNWRSIEIISLTAAGERHEGYRNAYPVVRVWTTAGNENEIELCASR